MSKLSIRFFDFTITTVTDTIPTVTVPNLLKIGITRRLDQNQDSLINKEIFLPKRGLTIILTERSETEQEYKDRVYKELHEAKKRLDEIWRKNPQLNNYGKNLSEQNFHQTVGVGKHQGDGEKRHTE